MGGRIEHLKGARDVASLVLHQWDGQVLQGGDRKLPEMNKKIYKWVDNAMLARPVGLNGVSGDGNNAAIVAFEGGGKRAEEAGRHRQEIALNINSQLMLRKRHEELSN